jgi:hypothetical protein
MNNRKILSLTMLLTLSLLLTACRLPFISVVRGSGNLTTEDFEVSDFSRINLDGAGQLIVTQGDTESLTIEAEDNVMDELTVKVEGNTLVLGFQRRPWNKQIVPTEPIVYTLSVVNLTGLKINGAADFEMESLDTDDFVVEVNGAGRIEINDLQAESIQAAITGSATMEISGAAASQTLDIDGAGNYDAGDLQTSTTTVKFNGLGNATVWASESLDVTINGAGVLNYYGSPSISQEINGAGDINSLGEK